MNTWTIIIIAFLSGIYLIDTISDFLNLKNISSNIPKEFENYFDAQKYKTSQNYLKTNTKFSFIYSSFFIVVQIVFIICGGFNYVDILVRSFGFNEIITGLIFAAVLMSALEILEMPFSVYSIFVIEKNFGFNKTTVKTFISDLLKNWILSALLGGIVFAVVIWFFLNFGTWAWLYAFIAVIIFELALTFIYPVLIMPLFNKYTPLEDGELKTSVENYATQENFKMKGLFKMDGSKRSTKTNAFFTGFGRFRRIVLFDTLIAKHTVPELTSILAHEMGHFKLGHILKSMIFSFANTFFMFFILSLFIKSPFLFEAFSMQNQSVYSGIIFFMFLYSPLSFAIGVLSNIISRKHEYAADAYAVNTYKKPEAMIEALKKLSVDNLSNLSPHKFKVFLEYSHPPILERISAIRKIGQNINP